MRALLRKDAPGLAVLAVDGLVLGLVAMSSVSGLWYRMDDDYGPGSLVFLWIAGGVLGLVAGVFEDASFTREYLLHRPVSAARLFWTRQLGCALVLLTWIVVTPALHLAGSLLFDRDAPAIEAGRYWHMLNQGAVGFAFYAVALFAATLVRRWLLALIVALALSLALLLFFGLALYSDWSAAIMHRLQGLISLAIALPLLLAARRVAAEGRDLDRPVSRARLASVACALVVFAVAGSAFLHIIQLDGRRNIIDNYPKLARLPDGTQALVRTKARGPGAWRVDESHRYAGPVDKAEYLFEPHEDLPIRKRVKALAEDGRLRAGTRYYLIGCGISRCYVGSDGRVHVFRQGVDDEPVLVRHLGKADGSPFAPRTQPLGSYWGRTALMANAAEGVIWRYDLEGDAPGFSRLPLPGDDRFVEDLSPFVRLPRRSNDLLWTNELIVRGARGVYVADRAAFQPASPEERAAVEALDRRRAIPPALVEVSGPVTFQATVPATAGQPAASHAYAPRTPGERALYFQMQALSLARAPLLALVSLLPKRTRGLGNPTDDDARILLDPLIMLGSGWALGLNLLLGVALAALTFRRLGRLGATGGRRGVWTALVAGFGLPAYVVYRACENRRAWHAMEVAKEPAPLLIRSAA